jgi:hypothetical protein
MHRHKLRRIAYPIDLPSRADRSTSYDTIKALSHSSARAEARPMQACCQ